MVKAYDELIDFLAAGTTPDDIAGFTPSPMTTRRVAQLLRREKTRKLTADEKAELDHYLEIEHLMRLAKARARQHIGHA